MSKVQKSWACLLIMVEEMVINYRLSGPAVTAPAFAHTSPRIGEIDHLAYSLQRFNVAELSSLQTSNFLVTFNFMSVLSQKLANRRITQR